MKRLFSLALLLSTSRVLACECPIPDFDASFKGAESIFVGKLTKIKRTRLWYINRRVKLDAVILHFKVETVWKGSTERKSIQVTQFQTEPYTGTDCALLFEKGKKYLVFASKNSEAQRKPLMTNRCKTGEYKPDSEWIKKLGPGQIPYSFF